MSISRLTAYIPARGGSKRIHRKNARPLGGTPAVVHVIRNLRSLPFVERVCVSSDDDEILDLARAEGAVTLASRSPELSGDHVQFLELLEKDVPRFLADAAQKDNLLFVVATSVLIPPSVYEAAFQAYTDGNNDVLVSVNRFEPSPFRALVAGDGSGLSPLFPEQIRMRTQDLPRAYVDAGCFYFLRPGRVIENGAFFSGSVGFIELPRDIAVDVDTEEDWGQLEKAFEMRKKAFPPA